MNSDEKRAGRLNRLFDQALKGKFTIGGKFSYTALVNQAKSIGVTKTTANDYADAVITRLKKGGYLG